MHKPSSHQFLVPVLVLAILFPSIISGHALPVYSAAVTVGQWASYTPLNVTYRSTNIPEPQLVQDLNQTVQSTVTVLHLYPPSNVTLQSTSQFKDATVKTATLSGNLTTGTGNLTYALIAGGLSHPDQIWAKPLAPSINFTASMSYLGTSRTVNISNSTMPLRTLFGVATSRQELVWDQMSGIILEAKVLVVLPSQAILGGFVEYTHVRVKATNIFYNPDSAAGFTIRATSPASVNSGKTATSTLTVTSVNGFTGTVTLTDTVPASITCSAITPNTVAGSGTASLSCSSTTPGTYTVTVTATSGTISHTTIATIMITAAPSQSPSASATILGLDPTVFYAIIGIVTIVIPAGAYLGLKSKSQKQEIPCQPTADSPAV